VTAATTQATNAANSATAAATSASAAAGAVSSVNGVLNVSVVGGTTLSGAQAGNGVHIYTGALTANATVTLPMSAHPFKAQNETTGGFSLTVAATGGSASVTFPANTTGATMDLFCDGSTGVLQGSTVFTAPQGTTANLGDSSQQLATDQFVQETVNGRLVLSVAGNSTVNLTAVQAGQGVLAFTGILTGNIAVTIPAASTGERIIENLTTGPYTLTVRTPSGTGTTVTQGTTQSLFCDGTDVLLSSSDLVSSGVTAAIQTLTGSASSIGFRNRIINGACAVAQYPPGVNSSFGGPDRFTFNNQSGGGQFTQSQGTITFGGVVKSAVVQTVNSVANNFSGSNQWTGIDQHIEGINVYDLLGSPVTISFIFNTNVAGTYSVSLRDGAGANSYVSNFSAAANTPVRVVITVATLPTSLSIPNSAATGLILQIGAQNSGSLVTGSLNSWISGNFTCASGQSQWGTVSGGFIAATEIQLEGGSVATPFERRPFCLELILCQRYYWTTYSYGVAPGTAATDATALWCWTGPTADPVSYASAQWTFPVTMRASPTVTLYNPHTGAVGSAWAQNAAASLAAAVGNRSGSFASLVLSGQSAEAHDLIEFHATASCEI
jgi:hypothetical protein